MPAFVNAVPQSLSLPGIGAPEAVAHSAWDWCTVDIALDAAGS
jgi:hypothetical protein